MLSTAEIAETVKTSLSNETERNTGQRIVIEDMVADPNDYPWFATLNGSNCGGYLVSPEYILTAAHCLNDFTHKIATIGKYCTKKYNCGVTNENIAIREKGVYVHPGYKGDPISMDFALLRLKKRSTITPVEMDFGPISDNYEAGRDDLWTVGLGYMNHDTERRSKTLEHLELKYAENDECKIEFEEDDWVVEDNMMCVVNNNVRKQACYGDSGGPLFDRRENKLVGVTNWGDDACTSKMLVYSRVSDQIDWITTTICERHSLPKPDFCTPSVSTQPSQSSHLSYISDALPPQPTHFQIVAKTMSDTKLCIETGNMITLQECNTNKKKQLWRADSSGQLRSFENEEKCMKYVRRDDSTGENVKMGTCHDEGARLDEIFVFNSFQHSLLSIKSNVDWQTYGLKAVSVGVNSTDALVTMEWHHYGEFTSELASKFVQKWDLVYPATALPFSPPIIEPGSSVV